MATPFMSVGSRATSPSIRLKPTPMPRSGANQHRGSLNHIGVVVDDLNAVEARVVKAGYTPRSHADYEPGKRFYFDADDGIEVEVVSYN